MKKLSLILLSILLTQCVFAQMDEKFYHPDKNWVGIDSLKFEEIVLPADNDTLYSVLFKPKCGEPKATVLYFHGNAGNISKQTICIRPLIDDGFQVCMLDYRGYGKSTGVPTHLNIARDAQKLLDTLLRRDDVKDTKLIVYGASIGSQVAANLTKNNNHKVSALVFDGMMTSFTDVALLTVLAEYHDEVRRYVTSPYSPKEDIKAITGIKILFIHSEADQIPIEGAKEIYDSSSCEKIFWKYDGGHVDSAIKFPDTFIEYINKLL